MRPFPFIVSIVVMVLFLTTCESAPACPLTWEPAVMLANGDNYGLPYHGPDPSLFPVPVADAMNQSGLTIPIPSAGGFMDFLQTLILGIVAYLLRRPPPDPKRK